MNRARQYAIRAAPVAAPMIFPGRADETEEGVGRAYGTVRARREERAEHRTRSNNLSTHLAGPASERQTTLPGVAI